MTSRCHVSLLLPDSRCPAQRCWFVRRCTAAVHRAGATGPLPWLACARAWQRLPCTHHPTRHETVHPPPASPLHAPQARSRVSHVTVWRQGCSGRGCGWSWWTLRATSGRPRCAACMTCLVPLVLVCFSCLSVLLPCVMPPSSLMCGGGHHASSMPSTSRWARDSR